VALASGAGVLIGIWVSLDISGAHLNLAVTIMQAVHFDHF
jgi:glycerol uptake facilitator-like aquaporin